MNFSACLKANILSAVSFTVYETYKYTWEDDKEVFAFNLHRYTRWVTRYVAVSTIGAIWILAAFVSFVPISLGLHRPNEPLIIEIRNGKEYPTCALDLTPTYAVVSSCISFYVPCIVLVAIYCRSIIPLEIDLSTNAKVFSLFHLSIQTLLLCTKARSIYSSCHENGTRWITAAEFTTKST